MVSRKVRGCCGASGVGRVGSGLSVGSRSLWRGECSGVSDETVQCCTRGSKYRRGVDRLSAVSVVSSSERFCDRFERSRLREWNGTKSPQRPVSSGRVGCGLKDRSSVTGVAAVLCGCGASERRRSVETACLLSSCASFEKREAVDSSGDSSECEHAVATRGCVGSGLGGVTGRL